MRPKSLSSVLGIGFTDSQLSLGKLVQKRSSKLEALIFKNSQLVTYRIDDCIAEPKWLLEEN